MIAAAHAIAGLAREKTPWPVEERCKRHLVFGNDYLLPMPGDTRLVTEVSAAVAMAAMESGVARREIASFKEYRTALLTRIDNGNFFSKELLRHKYTKNRMENRNAREHEF